MKDRHRFMVITPTEINALERIPGHPLIDPMFLAIYVSHSNEDIHKTKTQFHVF